MQHLSNGNKDKKDDVLKEDVETSQNPLGDEQV